MKICFRKHLEAPDFGFLPPASLCSPKYRLVTQSEVAALQKALQSLAFHFQTWKKVTAPQGRRRPPAPCTHASDFFAQLKH